MIQKIMNNNSINNNQFKLKQRHKKKNKNLSNTLQEEKRHKIIKMNFKDKNNKIIK